jgi:RimJ/RimL family protein N-acetyltransferase
MLTHAFEVWGVQRVSLKTDARNERSRAAIERLGARYDGTLRRHMPAYGPGGGPRDSAFFSILSDEWPTVKSNLETRLRSY